MPASAQMHAGSDAAANVAFVAPGRLVVSAVVDHCTAAQRCQWLSAEVEQSKHASVDRVRWVDPTLKELKRSHVLAGNFLSTPLTMEMKCDLIVWMALSAGFCW